MSEGKTSKVIGIFLLGFVLLNFPIINLFTKDQFIFGIPSLYIYFFMVWVILIIFIARTTRKKD